MNIDWILIPLLMPTSFSWSPEQFALVLAGVATGMVGVIGALATAAVKIISALNGVETKVSGVESKVTGVSVKVDALEVKVDGRLTQLLAQTASASRAEGVTVGRGEVAAPPPPPSPPTSLPDPTVLVGDELVIGIPSPMPPVLLVPVEAEGKPAEPGEAAP